MKGIFKILSVGILLAALVGAMYLVRKNQETRRGATAAETSSSVLPSTVTISSGQNFDVHVWLNTGKDTDSLAGAEFKVLYDSTKVKYVSSEPQNGYSILNDVIDSGQGFLTYKMVTLATEKSGAVDMVKITFTSLAGAGGSLLVQEGKIMVTGQSATWDIASNNPSNYSSAGLNTTPSVLAKVGESCRLGSVVPGPQCEPGLICYGHDGLNGICKSRTAGEGELCGGIAGIMCNTGLNCDYGTPDGIQAKLTADAAGKCVKTTLQCQWCGRECVDSTKATTCSKIGVPENQRCVVENSVCTIKEIPMTMSCGQRCTSDSVCGSGMVCSPIWWPCQTLSTDVKAPLQNNTALSSETISSVKSWCPQITNVLPTGYASKAEVMMPSFYGVCRNVACASSANCSCGGTVTPKPTVVSGGQVEMLGSFEYPSAKVGDVISAKLAVKGGINKISAISTSVVFDPYFFEILSVTPITGSQGVVNNFDNTTGKVNLYMFWSQPSGGLSTYPEYAIVKLKIKKAGKGTLSYERTLKQEVSGLDSSGNSVGFALVFTSPTASLTIADAGSCTICNGGLLKSTGNANCDSSVNSIDFEIWRNEMFDKGGSVGTVSSTWQADFSCDQKVSGADFEIWRKTVFN